jgi:hypothetical protein
MAMAGRNWILEEWHLYWLKHGKGEDRKSALKALGDMKRVSAVPRLLSSMKKLSFTSDEGTLFVAVFHSIGRPAIPILVRALGEGDREQGLLAANVLERIYLEYDPGFWPHLPCITRIETVIPFLEFLSASERESDEVRAAAGHALDKIRGG